jgi:hypothetical protein
MLHVLHLLLLHFNLLLVVIVDAWAQLMHAFHLRAASSHVGGFLFLNRLSGILGFHGELVELLVLSFQV